MNASLRVSCVSSNFEFWWYLHYFSVVTGSLNRVNDTYRRFLQFYFLLKNWYNIKVVENKIMIIKRRNTFFQSVHHVIMANILKSRNDWGWCLLQLHQLSQYRLLHIMEDQPTWNGIFFWNVGLQNPIFSLNLACPIHYFCCKIIW